MLVEKRTGEFQEFQPNKIAKAVIKAIMAAGEYYEGESEDFAKRVAKEVKNKVKESDIISIEEIQNAVEDKLMCSHYKETARAYIRYRYDREKIRNSKNNLSEQIKEKLAATNVENQNANVDEKSFGGRMGEVNRVVLKDYALNNCMSDMAKNNHLNNEIYEHDLDSYAAGMHNCLTLPIDKLLENGFKTRQMDVRPAGSINTAMQLVAVLFQIQSLQQFGGVSASHIDWSMVPYVRKSFYKHYKDGVKYLGGSINGLDNTMSIQDPRYIENNKAYSYALEMTKKECHQAVEGMYHNLNTLQSRSGNQLPFSSINYGTCTLPEGRMVTEDILKVSIEGLGALHRTSIFPCGIFQCMLGVNRHPGNPNYDLFRLALQSTAKRLYPNYANVDWSNNAGYDREDPKTYFSTMGKRKLQLIV